MSDKLSDYLLLRYGVAWEGDPMMPTHAEMPDGYWTPWHVAKTLIQELEQRLSESEANTQSAIDVALESVAVVVESQFHSPKTSTWIRSRIGTNPLAEATETITDQRRRPA